MKTKFINYLLTKQWFLSVVSNSNLFYTRDDVVITIKDCLKATGKEIKTTMHIDKSYVEFNSDDLDLWLDKHV